LLVFKDYDKLSRDELAPLMATDAQALDLVRTGLTHECRVPIEYSSNFLATNFNRLPALKSLALTIVAEGRLAELDGRTNDAVKSYLDVIRFGRESCRSGFLLDKLVGISFEFRGLKPLQKIVPSLDAASCRQAIATLQTLDENSEPVAVAMGPEEGLVRHAPTPARISLMIRARSLDPLKPERQRFENTIMKQQKLTRETMLDLAAHAYELEHGTPPKNIAELVPAYLNTIPQDPFTRTNIAYHP
jgi:hypothetical protein